MRETRSRLLVGVVGAALVVTLVPSPGLAEGLSVLGEPEAVESASTDAPAGDEPTGAQPAGDEPASEGVGTDAPDGDESTGAQPAGDEPASEGLGTDAPDGTPAEDQPKEPHVTVDPKDGSVHLSSDDSKLSYVERSWDGTQVVETTREDFTQSIPDSGRLSGGVYMMPGDANKTFKDRMVVTGNVRLVLCDGCELNAKGGIYVEQGAKLSIFGGTGDGAGRLVVKAKHGAGIGAYDGHKGGNIEVHGGDITVNGGGHCAGIGSNDGNGSDVGTFTMYGGKVTATGGDKGAGIGGGRKSEARVRIYGGEVIATGGEDGAGIGGGEDGRGGSIEILGGDVTATGSTNASGIGGGENRDAGSVAISGGTVHAYHRDGAGIGGGEDGGGGGKVTITGGEVHSDYKGQGNGAGIGGGNHSGKGGTITISGGDVTVENDHGAGIGGGRANRTKKEQGRDSGDGGTITISGGTVHTTSLHGHGIGAGGRQGYYAGSVKDMAARNTPDSDFIGSAGAITIKGDADVTARGYIAGVGGDSGTINVNGGALTAEGLDDHDGGLGIRLIDGGAHLNVTDGVLHATGAKKKAAVDADHISITGGSVELRSKKKAINGKDLKVRGGVVVKAGSSEEKAKLCVSNKRASACKASDSHYVLVSPCEHGEFTYECTDDYQHAAHCKYCDTILHEEHRFGKEGDCELCGGLKPLPTFAECSVPVDGTLGVEFVISLPKNLKFSEYEDSHMEFKVGKEGKTITVPISDARYAGGYRYGFTCPLNCVQMADEITATYRFGGREDVVSTATMKGCMDEYCGIHGSGDLSKDLPQYRATAAYNAIADYGHYSQVLLSRERGWKLCEDHIEMPAQTQYSHEDHLAARDDISLKYGALSSSCAKDAGLSLFLVQDAELTLCVGVRTKEKVGKVTVDGGELPAEQWGHDGDRLVIALPPVNTKDAGKGHSVVVTAADGTQLAAVENASPLTYASFALGDSKRAQDKELSDALTALYRYCEACK